MRYPVQSWVTLPENESVTRNCKPLFCLFACNLHVTFDELYSKLRNNDKKILITLDDSSLYYNKYL
jgi:hypothetical protein